jgi:hypothetical protein
MKVAKVCLVQKVRDLAGKDSEGKLLSAEPRGRAVVLRSNQHCKGAEVGFVRETCRRNLCRIPPPKCARLGRTWILTTTLVTARSALSLGLVVGKSSVIKQTLEMQREDTSATRDPLKEACLAKGVWVNS